MKRVILVGITILSLLSVFSIASCDSLDLSSKYTGFIKEDAHDFIQWGVGLLTGLQYSGKSEEYTYYKIVGDTNPYGSWLGYQDNKLCMAIMGFNPEDVGDYIMHYTTKYGEPEIIQENGSRHYYWVGLNSIIGVKIAKIGTFVSYDSTEYIEKRFNKAGLGLPDKFKSIKRKVFKTPSLDNKTINFDNVSSI